jgi:hypothetical protein
VIDWCAMRRVSLSQSRRVLEGGGEVVSFPSASYKVAHCAADTPSFTLGELSHHLPSASVVATLVVPRHCSVSLIADWQHPTWIATAPDVVALSISTCKGDAVWGTDARRWVWVCFKTTSRRAVYILHLEAQFIHIDTTLTCEFQR